MTPLFFFGVAGTETIPREGSRVVVFGMAGHEMISSGEKDGHATPR